MTPCTAVRDPAPPLRRSAASASIPRLQAGRGTLLALCALLLLALAFRVAQLGKSVWVDEAFTYWLATRPLDYLWIEVPKFESHPPFYATIVKAFLVFGTGEAWLRLPSVLAGLATLLVVFVTARRLWAPSNAFNAAGLLAAALLALSAWHIHFSAEARPYALFVLAFAVFLAAAVRLLGRWQAQRHPGVARSLLHDVAFIVSGTLLLWLHAIGTFFMAAVVLVLLGYALLRLAAREARPLAELAALVALIALLYLPDTVNLLGRAEEWQATWMSPITAYRARVTVDRLLGIRALTGDSPLGYLLGAGLAWLFVLGIRHIAAASGRWQAALILSAAALPGTLALAYSLVGSPILSIRTVIASIVPIATVVAIGTLALKGPALRAAAIVLLLGGSSLSAWRGADAGAVEEWRELVTLLADGVAPGDAALAFPPEAEIGARYYLDRLGRPLALRVVPAPYPAIGLPNPYPIGSPALPGLLPEDVARVVEETAAAPRIWLINRGGIPHDPNCMLPNALLMRRELGLDIERGGVRLRRYDALRSDPPAEPSGLPGSRLEECH